MNQQRHEPRGIKGSRLVMVFFLILFVISVGSYLVFRYLLHIPSA
jgi:hypothetical protein